MNPGEIAAVLRDRGWYQCEQFLAPAQVAALRADLLRHRERFTPAGIGRGDSQQLAPAVRSDRTEWLRGDSEAQRNFFAAMEELRLELNRRLFLGLFDYEAHFAHYPPGAHYRRHYDSFADSAAPRRLLSTVFYLNAGWEEGDGGELVLWDEAGREQACIEPRGGRAALFLSTEFPHEVRPCRTDRFSIAGWFRNNASGARRADPPQPNIAPGDAGGE